MRRVMLLVLLITACRVELARAQTGGGLETSGRWFLYDGKPIYLVGFDRQELASDPHLDYVEILNQYARYRINKVRIWIYNWWGGPALLAPWTYDRTIGKYNLDEWNVVYWDRMKDFLREAEARRIIVEISIFADYSYHAKYWNNPTMRYAWNSDYNVNGAFTTNRDGGFFPEFYDFNYNERSHSEKTVRDYQQALVDKILQELGAFSNIYFEVANEFPGDSDPLGYINMLYPWQQHWAKYIKERSPRPVHVHAQESSGSQTLGAHYFSDEPYVDSLGFHFYSWDPRQISRLLNPFQNKGKVLTNNETYHISNAPQGISYTDFYNGESRFAWALFTSGGYIGHADYGLGDTAINGDYSRFMATPEWMEGARRAASLRNIAESVRFWQLSPADPNNEEYDSLVSAGPTGSNWQVLCKPGSEYVIYFWGTKTGEAVQIALPLGVYGYSWHDVRNANVIGNGWISSAGTVFIQPPEGPWDPEAGVALLIRRDQLNVITISRLAYCAGDTWRVEIIGTPPGSSVHLVGTSDGASWRIPNWRTSDSSGFTMVTGVFNENAVGNHTLRFEVADSFSNTVSFKVSNCGSQ